MAKPVMIGESKAPFRQECGQLGVPIQGFTVCREKARGGLFALRNSGHMGTVGSNYASLMYADVRKESQVTKIYGEKYTQITAYSFRK